MGSIKQRAASAGQRVEDSPAWGNVIGVGLFLTVVCFIPPWGEPFTMPKVTIATITALTLIPLLWQRRRQLLQSRIPVGLASGFLIAAVTSLLFSGAPLLGSFWGDWTRRGGTLFVVALVFIFAGTSVLTRTELRVALSWLVWAGVPATAYGLVQLVGADPFPWTDQGWIVATFGNPNFAAAGLSMLALLTGGFALGGGCGTLWRLLMAPLAALEALLALSTGSSIAVFALASGALLAALAWSFRLTGSRRSLASGGIVAIGVVAAALTTLGLLGSGPLAAVVSPDTLQFRQWYWGAGLRMALSHPMLGVGPDGYGRFYGEYRSAEAAEMFTLGASAAHDVPLQWAATLGLPAAILYLALVVSVAAVVLTRLWRQGPQASMLAVPLLAAWGAYQVQSLVSIDETGIAVMGWFLMGALLAVTRTNAASPPNRTAPVAWVAAGAFGLVGLLLWLPPISASNSSRTVVQGTTESDVREAIGLVDGNALPCAAAVPVAQWMTAVSPSEATVEPVFDYAARDDRCYGMVNAAADFAIQLGQVERALQWSQQAVAIDPLNSSSWLLLTRAEALAGDRAAAQAAVDRASALAPSSAEPLTLAEELDLDVPVPPG